MQEHNLFRKLEYFHEGGSEKHPRDISGILALSPDQIDFNELNKKLNIACLKKSGHPQKILNHRNTSPAPVSDLLCLVKLFAQDEPAQLNTFIENQRSEFNRGTPG